ncbi:heavy metal translocating P-type ATPase [Halobaculum sp. MBLA0143]|uniref:heavy metal translocating P-type ATPase n=1 Tax=Halobaculum sp. MBLA0143 TaxID=3079933 RepID=UPI0035248065
MTDGSDGRDGSDAGARGEGDESPPGDTTTVDDATCTLCGLATPDPPVTDADAPGSFCCRGCLEVSRTLDDPAGTDAAAARDRVREQSSSASVDGEEAYLRVTGMHCASCESFLESRAAAVDGVAAADASYPADAMRLTVDDDADVDPETVADRVSGVGYAAEPLDGAGATDDAASETLGRILVGGFFGMMVMGWYVLFLYPTYFGLPSDALLFDLRGGAGGFLLANVWALTSVVLGYTGAPLLRGAYVAVRTGEPNMDLLVSLAAVTAYLYSTVALLAGRVEVYYDVSVVVVVAVTVGSYYERRVKSRAVSELTDLTRERVTEARRRTADGTETVPVAEVSGGDELVVKPGERLPTDGEILDGEAGVDESLVTGESLPVRRGPGDPVRGGTLVTDGRLVVVADEAGERTLDRVVSLLWDARGDGGTPQRLADALATVFVPVVLCLGVLAFAVHLALGATPTAALLTGLAVLVVSCPCALGLATPLATAAGTRDLLASGVVLADGSAVEAAADVDTVAFDKTGTLTAGEMRVTDLVTAREPTADGGVAATGDDTAERPDAGTVLGYAAAVEAHSDHPVADAVVDAARDGRFGSVPVGGPGATVDSFQVHPGRGVGGRVDGRRVRVGGASLFADATVPERLRRAYHGADDDGDLAAYVGWTAPDEPATATPRVHGVVVARDDHREGWETALSEIAAGGDDGRRIVVLTGDDGAAADRVADADAVDEVYAGLPPEAKTETVRRLSEDGTVAMVGDGSNDAPALAAADLGVAVATGTELAADAADAVVVRPDLRAVEDALSILSDTRRRVRENLAWAFGYNAVAVPAAVLGVVTPLLAAVAMAASSLLVVANSTRSLGDTDETRDTDGTGDTDETRDTNGTRDTPDTETEVSP